MSDITTLLEGIVDLEIKLNEEQKENFAEYKRLLKEWNEKINITAITEDDDIDIKGKIEDLRPKWSSDGAETPMHSIFRNGRSFFIPIKL